MDVDMNRSPVLRLKMHDFNDFSSELDMFVIVGKSSKNIEFERTARAGRHFQTFSSWDLPRVTCPREWRAHSQLHVECLKIDRVNMEPVDGDGGGDGMAPLFPMAAG